MIPLLPVLFFLIAFVYSMGGFAGGSSYVLALTMSGLPHSQVPATSLVCNVIVSSLVFMNFSRAGHFRPRLVAPFVLGSIPAAYLGASIHLPKQVFMALLSFSLMAASLRILFSRVEFDSGRVPGHAGLFAWGFPMGALMGFFSGLVGIGGGIFLWPALLLMRWATVKEASAAASFFILATSISGFVGQMQKGFVVYEGVAALAVLAAVGGLFGSTLGAGRMAPLRLQRVFASVLFALSVQLLARAL